MVQKYMRRKLLIKVLVQVPKDLFSYVIAMLIMLVSIVMLTIPVNFVVSTLDGWLKAMQPYVQNRPVLQHAAWIFSGVPEFLLAMLCIWFLISYVLNVRVKIICDLEKFKKKELLDDRNY